MIAIKKIRVVLSVLDGRLVRLGGLTTRGLKIQPIRFNKELKVSLPFGTTDPPGRRFL